MRVLCLIVDHYMILQAKLLSAQIMVCMFMLCMQIDDSMQLYQQ